MIALLFFFSAFTYEPEPGSEPSDYYFDEEYEPSERPDWLRSWTWEPEDPDDVGKGEFAAWLEEARRRSPRLVLPALEPRPPAPPHLTP